MQIASLIERASLVDYASQYTDLTLVKDEWWGISPLNKKDTNPSFSIRENMFYDFSAGCGGNILEFIQKHDHCDFRTAVKTLCDWLGVEDDISFQQLAVISAMKHFKSVERRGKDKSHQYLDESTLLTYRAKSFHFWDDEGLTQDVISKYGIGYDKVGECITIPVRDNEGRLINILCRTTNEYAAKLGIPKYIYRYKLGVLDFFWGWSVNEEALRRHNEVILVEGAKSVMKLASIGYDNAVACLTSHISDEQLKALIHYGYDVVIAFDKDINPYNDKNIKLLKRYCRVYIAQDRHNELGDKDSPCDRGADVWERIYQERKIWK